MRLLFFRHIIILAIAALAWQAASAARPARSTAPSAGQWEIGVDAGVAAPVGDGPFFPQMRPTFGLNAAKNLTPAFALAAEGWWGVNTSSWQGLPHSATAFDNSYIGAAARLNLFELFGPWQSPARRFALMLTAGSGWGHIYNSDAPDHNFFATKVGMIMRLKINRALGIQLQPSVLWDLSDSHTRQSSAAYDVRRAIFNLQAGVTYSFGQQFDCNLPYPQALIDGLNGQVNDLRRRLDDAQATGAAAAARAARLNEEIETCRQKPQVVREQAVNNGLNTVLDVFFTAGSTTVAPDQMPIIDRIAAYLNSHPGSKVDIVGYSSSDGKTETNLRLSQQRAAAVQSILISRYKIAPRRITAVGAGVGNLFEVGAWNRVCVCTLKN